MEKAILQEFLAQGLSLAEIGRRFGRDEDTVGYWVKKHGLSAVNKEKHAAKGRIPKDVLEVLVHQELTVREIADQLDVTPNRVRYWLKRYELATARAHSRNPYRDRHIRPLPKHIMRRCETHGITKFVLEGRGYYRCVRCRKARVAAWRRKTKKVLAEEAGGRCVLCGYHAYVGALHFHHLDPTRKSFQLSLRGITRSIEKLRAEARKCVLLCANCHAEVEGGVTVLTSPPPATLTESAS